MPLFGSSSSMVAFTFSVGRHWPEPALLSAARKPNRALFYWDALPGSKDEHRKWPHGHNYLQVRAGKDGEHLANLFLKDYTSWDQSMYFMDTVTLPKSVFNNYVRRQPNGVEGEFPFTVWVPPGTV